MEALLVIGVIAVLWIALCQTIQIGIRVYTIWRVESGPKEFAFLPVAGMPGMPPVPPTEPTEGKEGDTAGSRNYL